jgi:hypothetical protein
VTINASGDEGKKIVEGEMIPPPEPNSKSDPVAVADPRETQSPRAAVIVAHFKEISNPNRVHRLKGAVV